MTFTKMVLFLELCTELGGYQNLFSVGDHDDDDDDESMHEETIRGEKVCFDGYENVWKMRNDLQVSQPWSEKKINFEKA